MAIGTGTRQTASRLGRRDEGYVLLTLLLVVTLMVIAAAAAAPTISFEIRRDREQEMIHRGVQYSRAIRSYYKKFGRYPTRLEDLDNTNNLRYLRKHYKDPLNKNKDFKLLHYGDPGVSLGGLGSIGGGSIAGAQTVGSMNAGGSSGSTFGSSGFGSSSFSQPSSFGGNSNSIFGGNSGGFGGSSNSSFGSGFGNSASSGNSGGSSSGSGTTQPGSSDSSQTGSSASQNSNSTQNGTSSSSNNQQTFGGGPIVGVASVCKDRTIREFNKKKKYDEWQFVYDPTLDRGGLLTTPYQPMQAFGSAPGLGQPANASGSSFSQPSGFGSNNSSGFNSPGSNNSGFMSTPAQPPATPPQPQ